MTVLRARLALAAGLAFAATAPVDAQPPSSPASWYGTYEYTEAIPRLSGMTATIDYRLSLSGAGCRLTAQGIQTEEDIRCTARRDGSSLQIGFLSYGDGGMRNRFGVVRHRRGAPLLRLTRTSGRLVTSWQGFTMSDARRRSGRYFTKR